MPKIDPAMLKQINSAVDATLKKNKDIKAAGNIDKAIDSYMKNNREAMANAKLIASLEKRVAELEKQMKMTTKTTDVIQQTMFSMGSDVANIEKKMEKK